MWKELMKDEIITQSCQHWHREGFGSVNAHRAALDSPCLSFSPHCCSPCLSHISCCCWQGFSLPTLGKSHSPGPWRHHPDLSGLEPVTCLDGLMASDVCPRPLHAHPAHCPTGCNTALTPDHTGSGGAGNSPLLTNQQLGEINLCAPRLRVPMLHPECCILPTHGGAEQSRGGGAVLMPPPCSDSGSHKGSKGHPAPTGASFGAISPLC